MRQYLYITDVADFYNTHLLKHQVNTDACYAHLWLEHGQSRCAEKIAKQNY